MRQGQLVNRTVKVRRWLALVQTGADEFGTKLAAKLDPEHSQQRLSIGWRGKLLGSYIDRESMWTRG